MSYKDKSTEGSIQKILQGNFGGRIFRKEKKVDNFGKQTLLNTTI